MTHTVWRIAQNGIKNSLPQLRVMNILYRNLRLPQPIVPKVGKHVIRLILLQLLILIVFVSNRGAREDPLVEVGTINVRTEMSSSDCQATTAHERIKYEVTLFYLTLVGHQER